MVFIFSEFFDIKKSGQGKGIIVPEWIILAPLFHTLPAASVI
jgi:hypothetical protein